MFFFFFSFTRILETFLRRNERASPAAAFPKSGSLIFSKEDLPACGRLRLRVQSQSPISPFCFALVLKGFEQKNKKRTRPPPKKNHLGNFLASKKNFPGWWWIQKPYKHHEAISTTEIFPLWPPFFRQRKVPHWSRAVYAVFFSV